MSNVPLRSVLLLGTLTASTTAWWDGGHLLTAAVARQLLTSSEVTQLEAVLHDWEASFPGTGSSLSAASIWPDLIKCFHAASYCHTDYPPALSLFSQWHYNDKPFNPENLPLPEGFAWKGNPSATYALSQAVRTLKATKSRWSVNFMVRFALHIVGDLHQPLHTTEGFFNDTTYGELVNGDHGGNLIHIANPAAVAGASNLHAVWDSAGGLYGAVNWPLSESEQAALTANATALLSAFPAASFVSESASNGGVSVEDELDGCWAATSGGDDCRSVFLGWVDEMHDLAVSTVYPGVSNGGSLSPAYVANAQATSKRQIALAGRRLAGFLRLALQRSGEWEPGGGRTAAEAEAYIQKLELELEVLGGTSAFAFCLATITTLILCRIACKKRMRTAHIRALAHKQMVEIDGGDVV